MPGPTLFRKPLSPKGFGEVELRKAQTYQDLPRGSGMKNSLESLDISPAQMAQVYIILIIRS